MGAQRHFEIARASVGELAQNGGAVAASAAVNVGAASGAAPRVAASGEPCGGGAATAASTRAAWE